MTRKEEDAPTGCISRGLMIDDPCNCVHVTQTLDLLVQKNINEAEPLPNCTDMNCAVMICRC